MSDAPREKKLTFTRAEIIVRVRYKNSAAPPRLLAPMKTRLRLLIKREVSAVSEPARARLRVTYNATRLLIRLCVLVATFASAASARQESDPPFQSCPNAVQRIEVTVMAATAPDSEPTSTGLVWKIKELPGADKIFVCERLKAKILQTLNGRTPGPGNFQIDDGRQFDDFLLGEAEIEVQRPGGLDTPPPPSLAGRELKVVLCVTIEDPNDCPPPTTTTAARAEIQIATGRINRNVTPLPSDVYVFDAATTSGVPVKLFYSDEDLAAARRDASVADDTQAHARVREELLKVAANVFTKAVDSGGLRADGSPVFDGPADPRAQTAFTSYANALNQLYRPAGGIFQVRWLADVKPDLKAFGFGPNSAAPPRWVWSVDGLRLVEGVNIEVIEEDWETEEAQGETIAAKLRKRRQTAYDKLNIAADRPALLVKPGRVVSADELGSLTQGKTQGAGDLHEIERQVEAVEEVKSGPVVTPTHPAATGAPEGHNIIYAVRRKKKPELNLAFKVGGAYSEEDGATGQLGAEETNLLRLKETIALNAEGGEEVQKYRFSFTRAFERPDNYKFWIRDASIDAKVFKDKDARLGNLTTDEIEAREVGSSATISFGYDSLTHEERAGENCFTDGERKRARLTVSADVGLNYRDVNIPDDDKLLTITGVGRELLPRERTQATTLSLGVNAIFRRDFRKPNAGGLGVLLLRLEENAQKGFRLFGADYDYWKSSTIGGVDLTFGPSSFRDMFVSYRHGHERGSQGTPIFELPLLGGASSVRGLEEGEFIGRRVSFDQFDFGVNAVSVFNLLTRKGRLEDAPDCADSEPRPPFDPKNLYVKAFFDHGRLSDSPVTTTTSPRRADGYGVAVELRDFVADASGRRVNISIGYGRSPHSRLHRKGLMFTGVTFEF